MELLSKRLKQGWAIAISDNAELLQDLRGELCVEGDCEVLEPVQGWEIMLLKKSDSLRQNMEEQGIVTPMEKLMCMHVMGKVANRLMVEHIGTDGNLSDEAIDVLLYHIMKGA